MTTDTTTTVKPFRRVLHPANFRAWSEGATWPVFVKVEWDGKRLSLTGVEGPKRNGDAHGGCGQIRPDDTYTPATGWTADSLVRLWELWDRWHLNDMRAGCEHQRATWTPQQPLEVVKYGLTTEAMRERNHALHMATTAGLRGVPLLLTPTQRALAEMKDWYRDVSEPPDVNSPLSGCYEVKRREQRMAGSTYPTEHPAGLLTKPCDVCGYRYGSAWLYEAVPDEVLTELQAFPVTTLTPAWV